MTHVPILLREVVEEVPVSARRILDATLGLGGHAKAMLVKAKKAHLLGLDCDEKMVLNAQKRLQRFADRVNLAVVNFRDLTWAAEQIGWDWVDVILFDLGVSSAQLSDWRRGLSFQTEGPLDMRLDPTITLTAADIVNKWREEEIERMLWEAGEEPFFRRIARTIVREREKRLLKSTTDLVEVIAKAIPPRARRARKIHFATNTFRALRMTVNDELGSLREALPKAITLLAPKGRLLVISFHSLEDRIVKQTLKAEPDLKVLTKKPIIPTPEEIESNPRARSARLRIAIKRDRRNTN